MVACGSIVVMVYWIDGTTRKEFAMIGKFDTKLELDYVMLLREKHLEDYLQLL